MIRVLSEAYDNVRTFWTTHRMLPSPDWWNVRVEAALVAERRITRYEAERDGRLAVYERRGATEAYRIRWRDRRALVLDPARFTRVLRAR